MWESLQFLVPSSFLLFIYSHQFEQHLFVSDHLHDLAPSNHAASTGGFVFAGAAGKVKWNVAPRPPLPLAQIRPPCDSTIDLLIARPMPLPCGFVVKNASNIWSALPGGSPGPVSFTEISIWPSPPNCEFTVSTPPVSFIASMPFSIRFMSTC